MNKEVDIQTGLAINPITYICYMKKELTKKHWILIALIMVAGAVFRLIPHPLNFAPLAGMALLASAYVRNSWQAWLIPVAAFWASDMVLNNFIYAQYFEGFVLASNPFLFSAGAMLLIVLVGKYMLKKISIGNLILASLSASIIFFLVSNFGSWLQGMLPYPRSFAGLIEAYVAGLPFIKGTIAGDLVFTGAFFGLWHIVFGQRSTETAVA